METIKSSKKDYNVDMFINEMQEYAYIWNTSLRSYHDQIIRKNARDELRKKFRCPGRKVLTITGAHLVFSEGRGPNFRKVANQY